MPVNRAPKPTATAQSAKDAVDRLLDKIDELKHEVSILSRRLGEFGTFPRVAPDEKTREPRVALVEILSTLAKAGRFDDSMKLYRAMDDDLVSALQDIRRAHMDIDQIVSDGEKRIKFQKWRKPK